MSLRVVLGMTALLCGTTLLAHAEDWPQFRGPGGSAVTRETDLPSEWGADKNIHWKIAVPGVAWSSPVVVGDRVIVTTAITDNQKKPRPFGGGMGGKGPGGFGKGGKAPDVLYRWEVHCLDRATGKTLWKSSAIEKKPAIPTHSTNTYASETPACDGERIYAYFGMTGLYCFDLEGKKLWQKDLGVYSMMNSWGTGSSPVVAGELVFVQCDNEDKSFLIALDRKTGKEIWKKDRPDRSAWATPLVWKNKVRTEIVCLSSRRARSYEPATGEMLWELTLTGRGNSSASPVGDEEQIYFGNGGPFGSTPLYAVKAGAKGDITPKTGETTGEFIAWSNSKGAPTMASPLLYEGRLYVFDQRSGFVTCVDAKSGKQNYRERLPQARGITSSPWAYEGKVFCTDEDGRTFVIQAGPEFKLLGTNKLDEMFWSSPAVAGGNLFLRGTEHLFCIKSR